MGGQRGRAGRHACGAGPASGGRSRARRSPTVGEARRRGRAVASRARPTGVAASRAPSGAGRTDARHTGAGRRRGAVRERGSSVTMPPTGAAEAATRLPTVGEPPRARSARSRRGSRRARPVDASRVGPVGPGAPADEAGPLGATHRTGRCLRRSGGARRAPWSGGECRDAVRVAGRIALEDRRQGRAPPARHRPHGAAPPPRMPRGDGTRVPPWLGRTAVRSVSSVVAGGRWGRDPRAARRPGKAA